MDITARSDGGQKWMEENMLLTAEQARPGKVR